MKMLYFSRRSIGRRQSPVVSCLVVAALMAGGLVALPQMLSSAVAQENKAKTDGKPDAKKGGDAAQKNSGKRRRGRGGPATVEVDAVIRGISVETIPIYGRVLAEQTGIVAARTRGAVADVPVRIGDRVKKGDVLVTLVTDTLVAERALKAAELTEFIASVRTAGAQLQLASQELERLERLRKSAAFSVARYQDKLREVERFRSSIAEKRAKADQARAELRLADINLYNAKILAPYDGVVTQRQVEAGNFVSLGAPVISLINDSVLEVEGDVPANRIGGLVPETIIEVIPEFGKSFKASVRAIVPEENALARTRIVRFTPKFENRGAMVAANQSVILHIPSGLPREVTSVHKDAITQRRGKRVVFVFDEKEGRVQMREVELGDAFGSRFEVLKGLTAGDKVVIKGNERLRPNQQAKIASKAEPGKRRGRRGEGRRKRGGGEGGEGRRRSGDGTPSSENRRRDGNGRSDG
jgi:RND family efflux transporter MFP subunit